MKQRDVKPGKFGYDELCTLLEAAVSHSALLIIINNCNRSSMAIVVVCSVDR
jgi:hypothetical protein